MRLRVHATFLLFTTNYMLISVLLAGCAAFSGYPTNYQDDTEVLTADQPFLGADVRTIGNSQSDQARGGLTQQQYRDTVVYRRMEVIDVYYYRFESRLTGTYNGLDVGADLTALILNGLGATTGNAATKAALAAASAGVIGAKGTVNTDLFYQKTLPALVSEMRAGRQTALAIIKAGLAQPVAQYSIDQALDDINGYYIAGTLPSAVAQVTAQAGAAMDKANAALSITRDAAFLKSFSSRDSLETKVSALTPAQALKVYQAMQPFISSRSPFVQASLKAADPTNAAAKNGTSAKSVLKMWAAIDLPDTTISSHWTDAIAAATGGK
jgi:hypothetical protein